MRPLLIGLAAASLLGGCAEYGGNDRIASGWDQYDYNRPDPRYGGYEADRYYRQDHNRYQERQLSRDERIYRGHDGRYYCRRSDGTTGLIVGAIAGGTLGNIIAPGGSEALGTVLGAIAGGAAGRAIDQGPDVRCR
jgi:hypothetical protein